MCFFGFLRYVYLGDSDYKHLYLLHFLKFAVCLFLGLSKAVYLLFTMGKVLIRATVGDIFEQRIEEEIEK